MRGLITAVMAAGALALVAVPATEGASAPAQPPVPAIFRVGAAVQTVNPTYPVYLGGYGGGPAGGTIARHVDPSTGQPENLTVRAISIQAGGHVVELASIDSQGYSAGYDEGPYGITDIRRAVGAYLRGHGVQSASAADIIVSSLHEHAVPSVYGIYGPAPHQLAYLKALAAATTNVLEQAYQRAVPATITAGHADAPWLGGGDIPEGNEFEGWKRDGSLLAIWARDAKTGATIATYVSEPAYPNIVFGPADLVGGAGNAGGAGTKTLISGDFPPYAEAMLQQQLGGTAILASGSLANQASPMQADIAPSPDLPKVGGLTQTRAFDDIVQMARAVAGVTFDALAHAQPITNGVVGGAEQYVVSPVTDPAVIGLTSGEPAEEIDNGAPWAPISGLTGIYPADRANTPPYAYGAAVGTWVTALRIGDMALLSEPGEFFGSIHDAWASGIHAPGGIAVVGAAQDFLGYEYPAYVTPFTFYGGDELIFGPSVSLGDQVVTAGEQDAQQLGFAADLTSNAETTALDQQYAKVVSSGAYLLPSTVSGDLDARTGQFSPILVAAGSAPRTSTTCTNPALLYVPPNCPFPPPPIGPFHWTFGDGSARTTPIEGQSRASYSPFIRHAYARPGTYRVSVSVTSEGSTDTASLPVTVYPALHAAVVRFGDQAVAQVSGGDGRVLVERWLHADGSMSYGPRASARSGLVTLSVVDGTGEEVSVGANVPARVPSPTKAAPSLPQQAGSPAHGQARAGAQRVAPTSTVGGHRVVTVAGAGVVVALALALGLASAGRRRRA